jgi:HSP20 family molecular chaperone IbpA
MKTDVVKPEDVQVARRESRDEIMPNTAVRQDKDGFLLVAELPGVDDQSLQVTVEDGVLLIEADNAVASPEGYTLALREISPVTYKASFELPDRVEAAGVKASLKNGLLRVRLPVSEAKKPKRIAIAAE